ncbi:myb-like HTH transcriptional regulator family protein [Perilla frutescens var. frutescens]|nr:myb-like HTH transcriptional regulator family protein [Perilla frutescens var. frutescens]
MEGVQHSYGFPNGFPSQPPDIPQNLGAQSAPGGSLTRSPNAAFYAAEAYMGLSRYDFQENNTTFKNPTPQSGMSFFGDSAPQTDQISNSQYIRPNGSYRNDPFSRRLSENEQLLILKEKLLGDLDDTDMRSPSPPFDPKPGSSCNNPGSPNVVTSSKTRIRWTQDLHDRFVDCVNWLGGSADVSQPSQHQKSTRLLATHI